MKLRTEEFEELVREAVERIPEDFLSIMENVDVQVRSWPSEDQRRESDLEHGHTLLGLYQGIPVTDRANYNMVLPDIITIFQGSIESICSTRDEIVEQVRQTVVHEVAHYFGITDAELEAWGVA
ncbi:MAG: metallopeptidase family protein [Dehalococcoidia bacterium]